MIFFYILISVPKQAKARAASADTLKSLAAPPTIFQPRVSLALGVFCNPDRIFQLKRKFETLVALSAICSNLIGCHSTKTELETLSRRVFLNEDSIF